MSKSTVKCPSCGRQIPANMRFCGWCGFDLRAGSSRRVDTLPRPGQPEEQPPKDRQTSDSDKARTAPPPGGEKKPAGPKPRPASPQKPPNTVRPAPSGRNPGGKNALPPKGKNAGLILGVLAAAAVVTVAVMLVIKVNRTAEAPAPEATENVHVMNAGGDRPDQSPDAAEEPGTASTAPPESDTPAAEEPVSAAEGAVVVASAANIRSGPGSDYDILGTADVGTELERVGVSGSWTKVKYNGGESYIFTGLLVEKGAAGTVTVVSKANVRSGPGTGYSVVTVADAGRVLTANDHTGSNWYEVEIDGQTGYIAGNMVREN